MEKCEYRKFVCCKVLLYLGFEVLTLVTEEFQPRGCNMACFLLGLLFGPEVEAIPVSSSGTLVHFY